MILAFEAIHSDDWQSALQHALKAGLPVDVTNSEGQTLLHAAALHEASNDLLRYLIQAGFPLANSTDPNGSSQAIGDIAKCGQSLRVLEFLLNSCPPPIRPAIEADATLIALAHNKNPNIAEWFLERFTLPIHDKALSKAQRDALKTSAIKTAAQNENPAVLALAIEYATGMRGNFLDLPTLEELVWEATRNAPNEGTLLYCEKLGARIQDHWFDGYPNEIIIELGNTKQPDLEKLASLVRMGADPNSCRTVTGRSALCHEPEYLEANDVPMWLSDLITVGADPNVRQEDGSTPLHWAAEWGNLPAVDFLLSRGVPASAYDNSGRSPLSYWLEFLHDHGCAEMAVARRLVEYGCPIESIQSDLRDNPDLLASAVQAAADCDHIDESIVPFLLEAGANPTIQGKEGAALAWAAKYGFVEATRALLTAGAPINSYDASWKTATDHASEKTRPLLLSQGGCHLAEYCDLISQGDTTALSALMNRSDHPPRRGAWPKNIADAIVDFARTCHWSPEIRQCLREAKLLDD